MVSSSSINFSLIIRVPETFHLFTDLNAQVNVPVEFNETKHFPLNITAPLGHYLWI